MNMPSLVLAPVAALRPFYRQAARAGLVYTPDANAFARAKRAHVRNLADPGDCAGDFALLAGLAIAEAHVGRRAGWIPETQRIGCEIAKLIEDAAREHAPEGDGLPDDGDPQDPRTHSAASRDAHDRANDDTPRADTPEDY